MDFLALLGISAPQKKNRRGRFSTRAALVGHAPSASKSLTCMTIHVGRMRAFGEVQDQGIRL
jgi:hypothetical protein